MTLLVYILCCVVDTRISSYAFHFSYLLTLMSFFSSSFSQQVWEDVYGVKISDAANADAYNAEQLASEFMTAPMSGRRVGFIGLGAMGFGMATHLLSSNFCVVGYDVISHLRFLSYIALNKLQICIKI